MKHRSYTISSEDEGKLVLRILRDKLELSAAMVRSLKMVEDGITLDGKHVTVREVVKEGQVLTFMTDVPQKPRVYTPFEGHVDALYEDQDLLIVNKPSGLAVHPSPGNFEDNLANRLAYRFGEDFVFRVINRLDKGTSGLLCVAKNKFTAFSLAKAAAKGETQRIYYAVVEGAPPEKSGIIDLPIGLKGKTGIERCVRPDGKEALTHYSVVEKKNGRSNLEIEIKTGRTHQIRVHMAHLGCPVCGDFMYGTEIENLNGHALHAGLLRITHPGEGRRMSFAIEPPTYFRFLMRGDDNNLSKL